VALEHLGEPYRERVAEGAKLDRGLGPDVTHVEDEGGSLEPSVDEHGQADEERRRLDEDDVGRAHPADRGQAGERKREVVEDASHEAAVGGCIHRGPEHPDAVELFFHRPLSAVVDRNDTGRVVRKTCDDGDGDAGGGASLGELEQARLRRADLGRKVMGQEHDAQGRVERRHVGHMLVASGGRPRCGGQRQALLPGGADHYHAARQLSALLARKNAAITNPRKPAPKTRGTASKGPAESSIGLAKART